MKQSKPLYCLAVGYVVGASLNKIYNYDLVNNGYVLRTQFTAITFVKLADLNQPINFAGQTYFFGHSPQELYKVASLTKKDLDAGLAAEQNWVNLTKKKLQVAWQKMADVVAKEETAIQRNGGVSEIPNQAQMATPATPPSISEDQLPQENQAAAPMPPVATTDPSSAEPVTGTVERAVREYYIYAAAVKYKSNCMSVGYLAKIFNCSTGQIDEVGRSGYTDDFSKVLIRALKEAFESGIPSSSKDEQVRVTVYTTNEYVANMFAKNYLRAFARRNWTKKDGTDLAHKDLWEQIWSHAEHMIVTAVLCEPDDVNFKDCAQKAFAYAEEDYKKRYGKNRRGLIPPATLQE